MVLFDFLFIILDFVRLAVLDFLYKLDTKKRVCFLDPLKHN